MKPIVCLLLMGVLSILKASPYAGIYSGGIPGSTSSFWVAVVDEYNEGVVAVWDQAALSGDYDYFTVGSDGRFSAFLNLRTVTGKITGDSVSATVQGLYAISGTRKAEKGSAATLAGGYSGSYGGSTSGQIIALVAPDGNVWFYAYGSGGQDGGKGTLSGNRFSIRSVYGFTYSGTISTGAVSGSYSGGGYSGSFSLSKFVDNPTRTDKQVSIFQWYWAHYEGWFWTPDLGWAYDGFYPWVYMHEKPSTWAYIQEIALTDEVPFYFWSPGVGWGYSSLGMFPSYVDLQTMTSKNL